MSHDKHCCEPTPRPASCHAEAATIPAASCHAAAATATAPGCHAELQPAADACCDTPQNRDYFLWTFLGITAAAYLYGAFVSHDHTTAIGMFAGGIYELFNRMWWGLLVGIFFVGLLAKVPRDLVMGLLGRHAGLNGMLRATAAGVLLDLCSHGILAVGMKLYERGASVGQVMAFLLASPWNSFSLTLILFGLIGIWWTLLFILISAVIGIVTGLIFDSLVRRGTLPESPYRLEAGEGRPVGEVWNEVRQSAKFSFSGLGGIIRDGFAGSRPVIRWTFFGLVIAGAIRAFVPMEDFATWFGASFTGLVLTLLATTIIEVCSEGSTPIAADLLNRAAAPGNAFAFLMAGVATDYTEVMTIRETAKSWKIALFLPLITVPQVMVVGYILNQF
ncbi:permease [Haliea sp. E17]|uniref:permease n=1 Tax=Haliea sp. E17 TaxID=3401576 RepID=UPI003AAEB512